MALTPGFSGFNQLFPNEVDIYPGLYMSHSILPEDAPPPMASASPNGLSQPPWTTFPETLMGIFSTQDHHFLQGAPESTTILPQTTIEFFDNNVYPAQWDEINRMSLLDVGLTQQSMVPPVVSQSLPPPSSASTPASTLTSNWFKVPQMAYGRGRRQCDFNQPKSISFSVNGRPGINMRDALRKHFVGLDGRDNLMLQNAAGAISCRFLFPGYPSNISYQISTLGWTKTRTRITRSKLAYEVAKKLNTYLESMTRHQMDGSTDKWWKIGEGFMHLENMFLVQLVPVSKGSFQPEICVLAPSI